MALERSQLPPQFSKLHEPVDRSQEMVSWSVSFERHAEFAGPARFGTLT